MRKRYRFQIHNKSFLKTNNIPTADTTIRQQIQTIRKIFSYNIPCCVNNKHIFKFYGHYAAYSKELMSLYMVFYSIGFI